LRKTSSGCVKEEAARYNTTRKARKTTKAR